MKLIKAIKQVVGKMQGKPDCESAEWRNGKCTGYGHSEYDDEPVDHCKKCKYLSSKEVEK